METNSNFSNASQQDKKVQRSEVAACTNSQKMTPVKSNDQCD